MFLFCKYLMLSTLKANILTKHQLMPTGMDLIVLVLFSLTMFGYMGMSWEGSAWWSAGSAGPGSAAGGSASAGEASSTGWSSLSIQRGLRSMPESVSASVIPGSRTPRLRSSACPAACAPPLDQILGIDGRRSFVLVIFVVFAIHPWCWRKAR